MNTRVCLSIALFTAIFCLSLSTNSFAQNRVRVRGVVTNNAGDLLQGVSVTVKDTRQGTVTDSNGVYSINVDKGRILTFEHVGYMPYAQGITEAATLNVTLADAIGNMEEIVVIGYGTQARSQVTGAVSKLENRNLDEIPTSRLDNALIGKIAGVTIQNTTSEVGVEPSIRVRGFSSISANSSPLVVVDGYPVPDGLSFVDPQDVASIEVLKDAASAAIYGSRAANGVIIITTKSGLPDKPRYNFKAWYGQREPYKLNPMMSFTEYTEKLYREAAMREQDPAVAANRKNLITNQERAAYVLENEITGPTDWQQVGLQDASIYNLQLSVSGGKKDLKYYISGNMVSDMGIMKFSENTRTSVRAKLEGNLSRKMKFSINLNPTFTKLQRPAVNYTDYVRMYSYVPVYHNEFTAAFVNQKTQWANILPGDYAQARHFNTYPYSGIMPDGTLWTSNGNIDPWNTQNNTPWSIANRENRLRNTYRLLGGADLSYEIIPKLVFKTTLGGYYTYQNDQTFTKRNARQDGAINQAIIADRHYKDLLWENTLNYDRRFGSHNFNFLAGYTMQQTWIENSNIVGRDFPTDEFETLNYAAQIDQALTRTLKDQVGLISYLGRINYDFKAKYMLSASFRADGSSYFGLGHKWGYFPSVSAGWLVNKEEFLKNANDLSNLKLRVSYGATGNNRIPSFSFVDLLNPANYPFGAGTGNLVLGLSPNAPVLANPLITWERTFEFNSGIDLGFFANRLTLTLEYYNSITDRLLYNQATMSFTGSNEFINNSGKVRNQGIEIELGGSPVKNSNFEWTANINFTANRNKLLELGGEPFQYNFGERNEIYAAIVGSPAIQYFGYKTDGVWTSQAQIDEARGAGLTSPLSRYFMEGGLKFVDVNGDNIIDARDRVPIGSPFPHFLWGFNNTLRYKSWDLNILAQGQQGGQLVNGDHNYNEARRFNKNVNNDNRWVSPMFPGDGKTPYFTNGENWMLTDYVVESATYASLRNVILGYKVPEGKSLKRFGINGLRVYASAENLLYLMGNNYRGINPEARSTSSEYASPLINGYQRGAFPLMRTYTFGIDINF